MNNRGYNRTQIQFFRDMIARGATPAQAQTAVQGAAAAALAGGAAGVRQFMIDNGNRQRGDAWCGRFAASVVNSVGLDAPRNPEVASNWRNFGTRNEVRPTHPDWKNSPAVPNPQTGDIAVRLGPRTGNTGSHVTFVGSTNPQTRKFEALGGNQGGSNTSPTRVANYPIRQYEFFTPPSTATPSSISNTELRDATLPSSSPANSLPPPADMGAHQFGPNPQDKSLTVTGASTGNPRFISGPPPSPALASLAANPTPSPASGQLRASFTFGSGDAGIGGLGPYQPSYDAAYPNATGDSYGSLSDYPGLSGLFGDQPPTFQVAPANSSQGGNTNLSNANIGQWQMPSEIPDWGATDWWNTTSPAPTGSGSGNQWQMPNDAPSWGTTDWWSQPSDSYNDYGFNADSGFTPNESASWGGSDSGYESHGGMGGYDFGNYGTPSTDYYGSANSNWQDNTWGSEMPFDYEGQWNDATADYGAGNWGYDGDGNVVPFSQGGTAMGGEYSSAADWSSYWQDQPSTNVSGGVDPSAYWGADPVWGGAPMAYQEGYRPAPGTQVFGDSVYDMDMNWLNWATPSPAKGNLTNSSVPGSPSAPKTPSYLKNVNFAGTGNTLSAQPPPPPPQFVGQYKLPSGAENWGSQAQQNYQLSGMGGSAFTTTGSNTGFDSGVRSSGGIPISGGRTMSGGGPLSAGGAMGALQGQAIGILKAGGAPQAAGVGFWNASMGDAPPMYAIKAMAKAGFTPETAPIYKSDGTTLRNWMPANPNKWTPVAGGGFGWTPMAYVALNKQGKDLGAGNSRFAQDPTVSGMRGAREGAGGGVYRSGN